MSPAGGLASERSEDLAEVSPDDLIDALELLSPGPPVLCIMGPTAAGKTELAIHLADALADEIRCELVSVDSALVYRGMDIGTAKPTGELLAAYPHRLIDIRDPADAYSAAAFRRDALAAILEIRRRGHLPILVGGTMLYYRALLHGLSVLPQGDEATRTRLVARAAELGPGGMHRWLEDVDPVAAARIHPNDPQRVQRALEVHLVSGASMTAHLRHGARVFPLPVLKLARSPRERGTLHTRIEGRFDAMLAQGFIGEVAALMARGDLKPDLPSMRCVGYRQVWAHLAGECDAAEMRYRAVVATRQLAKRQFTWLRAEPEVHWLWDDEAPRREAVQLVRRALDSA